MTGNLLYLLPSHSRIPISILRGLILTHPYSMVLDKFVHRSVSPLEKYSANVGPVPCNVTLFVEFSSAKKLSAKSVPLLTAPSRGILRR